MSAGGRDAYDSPAGRGLSDDEPLLGRRGDASQPADYGIYNNLFLGRSHRPVPRAPLAPSSQLPAPSFQSLAPKTKQVSLTKKIYQAPPSSLRSAYGSYGHTSLAPVPLAVTSSAKPILTLIQLVVTIWASVLSNDVILFSGHPVWPLPFLLSPNLNLTLTLALTLTLIFHPHSLPTPPGSSSSRWPY